MTMTEQHIFAAVDLPFHVWVKEGSRWVLRETCVDSDGTALRGEAANEKTAQRAA